MDDDGRSNRSPRVNLFFFKYDREVYMVFRRIFNEIFIKVTTKQTNNLIY